MKNPFEGKEIWFLTGSQGLYGEETLIQVADQSKEIAALIDGASDVPVEVVWKPVLKDSDSIKELILEANANVN
jgi:L-arabinose isomerase